MAGSKVFVTGAGGFVGSRLAHRLALGEEVDVRALVHNISGANSMRVGRLPIEIEEGSVLDRERLDDLVSDCDAVVHCAHGDAETTIKGTRTVLEASERAGVESFVHMSSAAVHGHDVDGEVVESTPLDPDTDYARWKAQAEQVVRSANERMALSPTVFRPMIVYGPHSRWVTTPVEQLRQGTVLAEGGVGTLNQIHVDNLVDAIILAMNEPAAGGEVFLAVDDDGVTWKQYYAALGDIFGDHPPVKALSWREIRLKEKTWYLRDSVVPPARLFAYLFTSNDLRQRAFSEIKETPWAKAIYRSLPERLQDAAVELVSPDGGVRSLPASGSGADSAPDPNYEMPTRNVLRMQSATGTLSNDKLKETLGWEPRVSFPEAMELLSEWLEYEEIV